MLPRLGFACVDVGDIAEMHLRALGRCETVGQRLIGTGGFLWFTEMAEAISGAIPDLRIPTRQAPDLMVRLIGFFDPTVRSIVPGLGLRREFDTTPARDLLDIVFRDPKESVIDSARWLVGQGRA
jgi:dihydroflavonol-4-reductase